ncbi:MAG TPA: ABC transporter ATP-binding protein [Tepidisphaeraceae bacterium]|jgi:NitT/TauT family transport system ATP-binding protein
MDVTFDHITKSFPMGDDGGRLVAVRDVSLAIDRHEIVCLLGPSGCGKSTLLKMAAGLEFPTAGSVRVDDAPVVGPSPSRPMVFQDYALFPWLTVEKNVRFGLEIAKRPESDIRETTAKFIRLVGLNGFETSRPHQLSGGMKQRVGIARVLALSPRVLLMDEPFGALDSFTRMELQEQLIRLWVADPFTTLFVTHDIEEAVYLADRIVVMAPRPGRIKTIVPVDLSRPRHRGSPGFSDIRNHVLEQYERTEHVELEYAI